MSQAGHVAAPGAAQQWGKQLAASFVTSKKEAGGGRKKEGMGRGKRDREEGGEGRRKDTERKTEREPHRCQTLGS